MKKTLNLALVTALLVSAPGPLATRAVAAVVTGMQVNGGAQVLPTVTVVPSLQLGQGLSAPLTQTGVGSLSANLPSVALGSIAQVQPAATPLRAAAGIQAVPTVQALKAATRVSALSAKGEQLRSKDGRPMAAAIASLQTGAEKLGKDESASGRSAVLSTLFHGSRRSGIAETPAVVGSVPSADGKQLRSGDGAPLGAETSGRASALSSGADLGGLETVAKDSSKPQQARVDAVAAIAKQGGAAAKDALIRVSEANPEGGAADYEVHRAALKAVAETFDDIRSLRPVTQAHADQILAKLASDKPELAIFDYDDTLEANSVPLARETAAALKAAADAGVETAILTDRPDTKRDEKDKGITVVESLESMTPAERAAITLVSSRGTRTLLYKGEQPVLVKEEDIFWTDQQKEVILAAAKLVEERYGRQEYNGKTQELSTYAFSKIMPIGMTSAQIKEAAVFMQTELLKGGVDVQVVGRLARKETDPPYISVSKIDKSIGVVALRSSRNALAQMRDALRFGLPAKWAKTAYTLLRKIPSRTVSPQKMVVVGDQFFDAHVADYGFVKGAPGALAISVGGKADPRLQNIFVWPTQGRIGSTAVLQAMGRKVPSEMDKKAVVGLFAQRTVSIGVFILTSIAYPFIAVPVVGWAGYGALMAFGPLAAIATGPLNGLLVDKLSARNAMSINTLVRVALNLVLPVFSLLGVLNFWTLLIASIANGWLLSSVMTTENAYIKRLAGAKNVGTVNNLLWINYLFIQVFLSLILGIGSIVDTTGPLFAFYASAGLHLAVVLPIIWFTMPKLSTAPNSIPGILGRIAKNEKAIAKGVKNAEELKATNVQLAKDVEARRGTLAKQLPELKAAIAKSQAELAAVQAQKPAGIKAWINRFSTIMALKADINLRQKAAAAAEKELANEKTTLQSALKSFVKFLKTNAAPIAAFAGSVGIYLAYHTTLPIIGALIYWITTTDGFKALWFGKGSEVAPEQRELEDKIAANEKAIQEGQGDAGALREENKKLGKEAAKWQNRLRNVMLYLAMTAIFLYPLQGFGLPQIASALVGASAKGVLYGQLLGSLFFGNLIANAARAKLPEIRIPLLGRLPAERLIQGLVAGLAATWVATTLVPGSILAAAAAVAAAVGLMALARKFTDKAWLQFIGLGFSAIWIPYLAWGGVLSFIPVKVALMLALLAMGMFYGPAYVALQSYFQKHAAQKQMGSLIGVQGSMFNAATSLGYALISAAAGLFIPSFPPLLAVLGAAYFIGGLIFLRSGKVLPGLPKTLTQPKQ